MHQTACHGGEKGLAPQVYICSSSGKGAFHVCVHMKGVGHLRSCGEGDALLVQQLLGSHIARRIVDCAPTTPQQSNRQRGNELKCKSRAGSTSTFPDEKYSFSYYHVQNVREDAKAKVKRKKQPNRKRIASAVHITW